MNPKTEKRSKTIIRKLFLGLSISVSALAFSQQFGLKGGATISSISDDGYDKTKSKTGFYAGAFVNIPASELISIQPEIIYNNLGSEVRGKHLVYGEYTRKLNLNYVAVPIMFQFKATPQFYIEAGPELGFLVNVNSKTAWNSSSTTTITELKTNDFNKFNLGLGLGAGFDINKRFGINARYVAGFSDITKPNSDPSVNAKNKNNGFQLGVNLKF